ncbi:MAG: tetratricopeptide repeat protein [Acidobacteria bacterium]|nr:tetratricopeptide repeat protein [Acidobacteriota bacterium]
MVKESPERFFHNRSAAVLGRLSPRREEESTPVITSRPYAPESQELEAGLPPFAVLLIRAVGPDHPDVAKELHKLAVSYHKQKKYQEAESLYARGLAAARKTLGESHLEVATILNNMARLFHEQKKYADAEPLYHRSIAILEEVLGPDHPKIATRLKNLASLYRASGEETKAELFRKRLQEILK